MVGMDKQLIEQLSLLSLVLCKDQILVSLGLLIRLLKIKGLLHLISSRRSSHRVNSLLRQKLIGQDFRFICDTLLPLSLLGQHA